MNRFCSATAGALVAAGRPLVLLSVAALVLSASASPTVTPAPVHSFRTDVAGTIAGPFAALTAGNDGNLYGTTSGAGVNKKGSIFRMSLSGVVTTIYSFTGGNDGQNPVGPMVLAPDGSFYGTESLGQFEATFKVSSSGVLTVIGGAGSSNLMLASNGKFYVTTNGGHGGIYQVTTAGTATVLYTFTGGADGGNPVAGLVEAGDGNLYGTTQAGGTSNLGTVFKITPTGTLTTIHSFAGDTDGQHPTSTMAVGTDGKIYGVLQNDVFSVTTNGVYSIVHQFVGSEGGGSYQLCHLMRASDGNVYGETQGGANNDGSIYEIDATGNFIALGSMSGENGDSPFAGLAEGPNGALYGVSQGGGAYGFGSIFAFPMPGKHVTTPLVWQGTTQTDRRVAVWDVDGTLALDGPLVNGTPPPGWSVVDAADFDGDGNLDLFLQNPTTGQLGIWYLDANRHVINSAMLAGTVPWRVAGIGDFNGDGHPDILFQAPGLGYLRVLTLNNSTILGSTRLSIDLTPQGRAVGVASFDGDDNPDIVIQRTTDGRLGVFFMNGFTYTHRMALPGPNSTAWQAVAVTNAIGKTEPEIYFQNGGQETEWDLAGLNVVGAGHLSSTAPPGWDIVGPK